MARLERITCRGSTLDAAEKRKIVCALKLAKNPSGQSKMVESFSKLLIVEIVWKLYFNRNTPPSSFYFLSINGLRRVNATLRLQFFFSTRFALLHRVCVCVFFLHSSRWNQLFQEFASYFFLFFMISTFMHNFMKFKNIWNFLIWFISIPIVLIHGNVNYLFVPTFDNL